VDLQCVEEEIGPFYYRDHLPLLGKHAHCDRLYINLVEPTSLSGLLVSLSAVYYVYACVMFVFRLYTFTCYRKPEILLKYNSISSLVFMHFFSPF
jgi:hypothetical protein